MRQTTFGMIGFGQIGQAVAKLAFDSDAAPFVSLAGVLVRDRSAPGLDWLRERGVAVHTDVDDLLAEPVAVIAEAAGQAALRANAETVLRAGKDMVVVSVGALADESLVDRLQLAASTTGSQLVIPSGAIAGLDAISASALGTLHMVTHTTRKHPRAFARDQRQEGSGDGPVLLFEGPAREGVRLFPQNVNVAAAVALAGIGFDRTILRVFADPSAIRNTHQVEVVGDFGRLRIELENEPTANPKTGRIVPMSVVKALAGRSRWIVVGA